MRRRGGMEGREHAKKGFSKQNIVNLGLKGMKGNESR
jgi:hypothetical protein